MRVRLEKRMSFSRSAASASVRGSLPRALKRSIWNTVTGVPASASRWSIT